jgi:hypothetical protein
MIWEYGNYKFDCELKPPTWEKFNQWKKDFFKLPNVTKYDIWLTGGFVENWKTLDVDIVLTGKPNYKELQKLITDWTNSEKIFSNLYSRTTRYPKKHQLDRVYKNKPILLKQG